MTSRERINRADSHARAMAHRFGQGSREASEAREVAEELRERAIEEALTRAERQERGEIPTYDHDVAALADAVLADREARA